MKKVDKAKMFTGTFIEYIKFLRDNPEIKPVDINLSRPYRDGYDYVFEYYISEMVIDSYGDIIDEYNGVSTHLSFIQYLDKYYHLPSKKIQNSTSIFSKRF